MANTNKTKAEILQELESIKGLLLEEDGIPILQNMEDEILLDEFHSEPPLLFSQHETALAGQASLFDETISFEELSSEITKIVHQENMGSDRQDSSSTQEAKTSFSARLHHSASPQQQRLTARASGENPFLPQHIRERLHGNNPPPLFEYETAKKIISSTKNIAHKTNKPRQYLVEEVMLSMMPQIERELRHRLFAMSVEDLEKLLNEDED